MRRATLIPHVYPVHEPGLPFFAFGLRLPRTPVGRALWRRALPLLESGLRRGTAGDERVRARRSGSPPLERLHGGISRELAMVATFPQLEYPRRWPSGVHVTGPMEFELPYPEVELPDGEEPLVLVAPSTAQDPELRLVRVALEALADEPVRVMATTNRLDPAESRCRPPRPTRGWSTGCPTRSVMPEASLVICHGGHGTVARALAAGVPVLCCPHVGDMAENRRAGRVGRRWSDAAAGGCSGPVRCGGPRDGSSAIPRLAAAPANWRRGRRQTTAASMAPSSSRSNRRFERPVETGL